MFERRAWGYLPSLKLQIFRYTVKGLNGEALIRSLVSHRVAASSNPNFFLFFVRLFSVSSLPSRPLGVAWREKYFFAREEEVKGGVAPLSHGRIVFLKFTRRQIAQGSTSQQGRDATKNFSKLWHHNIMVRSCSALQQVASFLFSLSFSSLSLFLPFFSFSKKVDAFSTRTRTYLEESWQLDTRRTFSPFVAPCIRVKAIGEERGKSFVKEKHPTMRHVVDQFHL